MAEVHRVFASTVSQTTHEALAQRITATLAAVRAGELRIHAITGPVAQEFTANGLSALGARPSLTVNAEEIDSFIVASDAALLNLGMLDKDRMEALPLAARACVEHGKPFVVDPVFADASPHRRALARHLLTFSPKVVKLNLREAEAFVRDIPAESVTLVTAEVDRITFGKCEAKLANGHALLAQTNATGCLLGGLVSACVAVTPNAFHAAIAGVSILNIAAEIAAERASGPGSFGVQLIDALAALDGDTIHRRLKIEKLRDEEA